MKVILTENVYKLGQVGDIVQVKDGYGRNFLIPQGKAILALKSRKAQLEHHQRILKKKREQSAQEIQDQAQKLEGSQWSFIKKVGAQNKLFGTVTTAEIHAKLKEAGYVVDRRGIKLLSDIKFIGTYQAQVLFPGQVIAQIEICVQGDEDSAHDGRDHHGEVPGLSEEELGLKAQDESVGYGEPEDDHPSLYGEDLDFPSGV